MKRAVRRADTNVRKDLDAAYTRFVEKHVDMLEEEKRERDQCGISSASSPQINI